MKETRFNRRCGKEKNGRTNLGTLLCLDIYLAYLNDTDYQKIKAKIQPLDFKPHPLLSYGISPEFKPTADNFKPETERQ